MAGMTYVQGRQSNMHSYTVFETLIWTNFRSEMNKWRFRTLKIPPIYAYANPNHVVAAKLPFSAMWSPAFVPKPEDWPKQCQVVGTFFIDQKNEFDLTPFKDLSKWLENGPKPIFIGYGSMIIDKPEQFEKMIKKAAHTLNFRIVVQSNWTKLNVEDGSDLLRNVGPCPHDWLLPQCSAVVHHGGAGTTAAGLRFGLPTFVCPFFADQFMWGFFVEMAGVGPKACPVSKLTDEILADRLEKLTSAKMQQKAQGLAEEMALEDGIEGGFNHFVNSLPRESMLCDVSLVLGETQRARYELIGTGLRRNGIKVSTEVAAMLMAEKEINWHSIYNWIPTRNKLNHRYWFSAGIRRHAVAQHNLNGHVKSCHHGFFAGLWGLVYGALAAPMQLYWQPDRFARSHGACGCLFGLFVSAFFVIGDLFIAIMIFLDRWAVGASNGCFRRDFDFLLHPAWKAKVHEHGMVESEVEMFTKQGIPKARRRELMKALDVVVRARLVFESARPTFPGDHRHFVVVRLKALEEHIRLSKYRLKLTSEECDALIAKLDSLTLQVPVEARRQTRFPRIQSLRRSIKHGLSSVMETGSDEKGVGDNGADTTPPDPLKVHGAGSKKVVDKLCEPADERPRTTLPSPNTGSWTKSPEDVEVSFSMFLQALQMVCGEKYLLNFSRRRTLPMPLSPEPQLDRSRKFSDYSMYSMYSN